MYLKIKKFTNGKPIIYGSNVMRSPYGVNMSRDVVLIDNDGYRLVTEGSFIVGVGSDIRFLPRTKLKTASATNAATITLKAPSYTFKVGDVLYPMAAFGTLVFSGTSVANTDVFTARINGVNYAITSSGTTAASNAAQFVADNGTALAAAGITATQRGSTATVDLYADNSYKVVTSVTNGATTLVFNSSDPGYFGDRITPLGTILSIAAPNADGERVVTLAANAAYVVPANTSIGVVVDEYIGIYPDPLDFTEEMAIHLAPIAECDGVYEQNLPYVDNQIKRVFGDLRINKRFYRAI